MIENFLVICFCTLCGCAAALTVLGTGIMFAMVIGGIQ